jgi:hypothetical protein
MNVIGTRKLFPKAKAVTRRVDCGISQRGTPPETECCECSDRKQWKTTLERPQYGPVTPLSSNEILSLDRTVETQAVFGVQTAQYRIWRGRIESGWNHGEQSSLIRMITYQGFFIL